MHRIGYLVPEFPSQTHIFFWREIEMLKRHGIEVDLLSTRPPPPVLMSHRWSQEAARRTTYLMANPLAGVVDGLRATPRLSPSGWVRSAKALLASDARGLRSRGRLLGSVVLGARLVQRARSHGWNHVHAHICSAATDIAMFAHLLSGLTYSITLHSSLAEVGPNQPEKWRHASFAIVVSRTLLEEARELLGDCLPQRIAVAPMGVDVDAFRRPRPYAVWDGSGPFRIFSCGRLNVGKGHSDLIKAVGLLRRRGIDARLRIAGEDRLGGAEYRRVLEDQIAQAALADSVSLLGALPEEGVRDELAGAHVFSLASLNEALGVATMEAMAYEVPVVVTRVGGVPELVGDGQDGLLANCQAPDDLADKIERIARDGSLAVSLGQGGRRKICASFHHGRSAEALSTLLAEVPGALG